MPKMNAPALAELPDDLKVYMEAVGRPISVLKVTIRGLPPGLLMCKMTAEDLIGPRPGERAGPIGPKAPRTLNDPEKFAYRLENGELCIPNMMLYSNLIAAAKGYMIPMGKGRKQSAANYLAGVVRIWPTTGIGLRTKTFETDVRTGVNHNTNPPSRVAIARPLLPKWEAEFHLSYDPSVLIPEVAEDESVGLRAMLSTGGMRYGIGSFRPEKKGPFGTFVVKEWERI